MVAFDIPTFLWLHGTADSPLWLLRTARFVSLELPALMIAGTAGAWIVGDARVRRTVHTIVIAMALAWIVARIGQAAWPGAARPFTLGLAPALIEHGGSPSFPSTHASVAFAFATVLAASGVSRGIALGGLALAAAIGWSRIYLGVHFPSDVLGGLAAGLLSAWGALRLAELRWSKEPRRVHP